MNDEKVRVSIDDLRDAADVLDSFVRTDDNDPWAKGAGKVRDWLNAEADRRDRAKSHRNIARLMKGTPGEVAYALVMQGNERPYRTDPTP